MFPGGVADFAAIFAATWCNLFIGAKLTATDLPDLLSNLRCNLNRNTRGHRRHEPQVAVLSWGHELEQGFPHHSLIMQPCCCNRCSMWLGVVMLK